MTNDQFEAHIFRFTHEPGYEAGYRVGLAGPSMLRPEHVRLEPAWADGWHAGMAEVAMMAETIAEWMSRGRPRGFLAALTSGR
jgi:hypothetical protein